MFQETPKPDAGLRILTPSWDVLARHLTGAIMTIALATAALQAAKDVLICMPAVNCTGVSRMTPINESNKFHADVCYQEKALRNNSTSIVITTMVDYRQYAFVDSACFQKILEWYPTYFPFILFVEAVILIMIDNFWMMYPKTSSALNHFVVLVMECYSSVGTFSEILQVLKKPEKKDSKDVTEGKSSRSSTADVEELELIVETPQATSNEEVSETKPITIDMEDAMKVKTLYEKIEEFGEKYGSSHVLLNVYKITVVLQIIISSAILIVNLYLHKELSDSVNCQLDEIFLAKYEFFLCSRFIAPYYRAISLVFLIPVGAYFVTSLYSFCWTFKCKCMCNRGKFGRMYPDEKYVDDDFKIKGDLVFLISLLEQYNRLYSIRFLLFLSKKNKEKLDRNIEKAYRKTLKEGSTSK